VGLPSGALYRRADPLPDQHPGPLPQSDPELTGPPRPANLGFLIPECISLRSYSEEPVRIETKPHFHDFIEYLFASLCLSQNKSLIIGRHNLCQMPTNGPEPNLKRSPVPPGSLMVRPASGSTVSTSALPVIRLRRWMDLTVGSNWM